MKTTSLKTILALFACSAIGFSAIAQEEGPGKRGFKKENLFTGGSVSLGFSNNSFQAGASPFFGYSIAPWVDAGITVNYNYTSYKDVYSFNDKLRRSTYGGGAFTRLYPVRFLFVQGQFEHNFITQKYLPSNNGATDKAKVEANSLLLGAGFASGRYPEVGSHFFTCRCCSTCSIMNSHLIRAPAVALSPSSAVACRCLCSRDAGKIEHLFKT